MIVASILQQLAVSHKALLPELVNFYDQARLRSTLPELEAFVHLIKVYSMSFESVFCILDGLDECNERERRNLLDIIRQFSLVGPHFRIFVTSRDHLHDIQQFFENEPTIHIHATDSDIRNFVVERLYRVQFRSELKEHMMQSIVENAQGM